MGPNLGRTEDDKGGRTEEQGYRQSRGSQLRQSTLNRPTARPATLTSARDGSGARQHREPWSSRSRKEGEAGAHAEILDADLPRGTATLAARRSLRSGTGRDKITQARAAQARHGLAVSPRKANSVSRRCAKGADTRQKSAGGRRATSRRGREDSFSWCWPTAAGRGRPGAGW